MSALPGRSFLSRVVIGRASQIEGVRRFLGSEEASSVLIVSGEAGIGVPNQIVLIPRPAEALDFPLERGLRNVHHMGLEIARGSLTETQRELEAKGFEVRTGEHPFLPVEAIYVDDPDGNEVELVVRR